MPAHVTHAEMVVAASRSWDNAVLRHIEQENFGAAHHLVDAARDGLLTGEGGGVVQLHPDVVETLSSIESVSRSQLDGLRAALGADLRTARANNLITEEQDAELTSRLNDAGRDGADLAVVRATLGPTEGWKVGHR